MAISGKSYTFGHYIHNVGSNLIDYLIQLKIVEQMGNLGDSSTKN